MKEFGLVLFLAVLVVDVLILWGDLLLLLDGEKTISEHVWEEPPLSWPILAWQVLGVGGLAIHFYA